MSTTDVVAEIRNPDFNQRVGLLSFKVAQNVASEDPATPNHANRVQYSNRIFVGSESAVLLTSHVVSSNPTIYSTVESEGGAAVPDSDIEFALASIWDARANAFALNVSFIPPM
jgi:hypothetical protein